MAGPWISVFSDGRALDLSFWMAGSWISVLDGWAVDLSFFGWPGRGSQFFSGWPGRGSQFFPDGRAADLSFFEWPGLKRIVKRIVFVAREFAATLSREICSTVRPKKLRALDDKLPGGWIPLWFGRVSRTNAIA